MNWGIYLRQKGCHGGTEARKNTKPFDLKSTSHRKKILCFRASVANIIHAVNSKKSVEIRAIRDKKALAIAATQQRLATDCTNFHG